MNQPTALAEQAEQPLHGGSASWACNPGFPPSTIFPFTPPERIGIRNLMEFQTLMYRPLYWLGRDGQPGVDFDLSLAEPPEWSPDGRRVVVTLKPWKWSNGETVCADNVMFWLNMLATKGVRYGGYSPGYLPDNLESYEKIAEDKVALTFDKQYSKTWVLMNQLTMITPMPKAWDRTADDAPANASGDIADVPAVYDYLAAQNGEWTEEDNEFRTGWPTSPVWSVVNGPWRMKEFALDGSVTFVPNEHYSGPNVPHLDEFRLVPMESDEHEYGLLQAGPDAPAEIQVGYLPYGLDHGTGTNPLAGRYRLVPQSICLIHYMPLNFKNPTTAGRIINQTYFRQALQCTVDQETAIQDIFQGHGYRTTGPVPSMPESDYLSPDRRRDPMALDIQRARKLLEDNGWDVSTTPATCVRPGDGPGCAGAGIEAGDKLSLTLRYVAGRVSLTRTVEQIVADAAKAGIEVRPHELFGSTLVGQDHSETEPDNPHLWELQCWNGGWVFHGHPTGETLFKTGAASNFGHYSDPKADELIDRTVVSDDLDALYEYQDYVADQVPVVWMPGFPMRVFAVAEDLRGIEPVNPYGMLTPETWYYVAGKGE
ncbi:peptide/nickel transport system substrate-binding protein [Kibdelosporangium banguiense]|uniref:Peptide/nickel transport system substrate-binding protein n=1 Tax=Kibdelosporangium banguiense TaxID=1365924 RepID=A0ABS4TRE6_9PSEU|nr:ABC transporter substrate-binding protein [Kibdelosporangium banguiense]MBP2326483.1 peptide/nickel transport system substrate-binding protein [Kibdelosporangium banguiense]